MALKQVNLSTDVYFVCLNHAMSTDGEEIVGLLVGEVDEHRVAHVSAVVILRRSDKRKDRVEISPEQLSNASTEAERLACILKKPIRVIGWYHSHPKLTVWPSPIDVNTQDSYQLMDEGFIGVIFSVFNEDPNKKGGRIQMTCFQSQTIIEDCNIEKKRLDIPVHLVPAFTSFGSSISSVCMNALIQLPRFLCQEEQLAYQLTNQIPLDYLTRLHNSSVYIKSMGQIAEVICGPLLKMLEERIINNEIKRKKLQEKKKDLIVRIDKARKEKEIRESPASPASALNKKSDSVLKSLTGNKSVDEKNIPDASPPQDIVNAIHKLDVSSGTNSDENSNITNLNVKTAELNIATSDLEVTTPELDVAIEVNIPIEEAISETKVSNSNESNTQSSAIDKVVAEEKPKNEKKFQT